MHFLKCREKLDDLTFFKQFNCTQYSAEEWDNFMAEKQAQDANTFLVYLVCEIDINRKHYLFCNSFHANPPGGE